MTSTPSEKRIARWWFGGVSSGAAALFTHPLDLVKVNLQTQQGKISMIHLTSKIVREEGFFSLYNGISASLLRQFTYSLSRFGIYEVGKDYISTDTFVGKLALAGVAGTIGGFVGTPGDMINVRMQNDMKLLPQNRRNYKHALDGLVRVYTEEGFKRLFSGATTASGRGLFMTIGQIAFYDQIKSMLLETSHFKDDVKTHLTASLAAGAIATAITQPLDVLKTRAMNAKPGEFKGLLDLFLYTAKLGPLGFFKGFIPAFVRIGPHTVLIFLFFEQLRLNFGIRVIT